MSQESYERLLEARTDKQLLDAFMSIFNLNLDDIMCLEHYMCEKEQGFATEECRLSMKDCHDNFFMRQLLRNNGILIKKKINNDSRYHTYKYIENSAKDLEDMEYIIKFKLYNYEILYLLDPGMLIEARKLLEKQRSKQ